MLTGDRVGGALLRALPQRPRAVDVDWRRVEWWWGDERFLPADDPDRNETQARASLLDSIPVSEKRVHPMPATDGPHGGDLPSAAAAHDALLRRPPDQHRLDLVC